MNAQGTKRDQVLAPRFTPGPGTGDPTQRPGADESVETPHHAVRPSGPGAGEALPLEPQWPGALRGPADTAPGRLGQELGGRGLREGVGMLPPQDSPAPPGGSSLPRFRNAPQPSPASDE